MIRTTIFSLLALLVASYALADTGLKSASVVDVRGHEVGRIAFWEGRVPIDDGYPFFDLTLSVDKKTYIVRYESGTGYFPATWQAGREIKVRLQSKGRMYLLNGSEEVPVRILDGNGGNCVLRNSPSVVRGPGSQVSCD